MAAPMVVSCLRRVSTQYRGHIVSRTGPQSLVVPCFANLAISSRHYAAKAKGKKSKRKPTKKPPESEPKEKKKIFTPPLPSEPTDDVYLTWCYQKPIYEAEVALDMLRKFQQLDFTCPKQDVYAGFTLDMAMEKKKKVDQFVSALLLPYCFREDFHTVLVFTENAEETALARDNGAAFVGGTELIKPIIDCEIQADFYVAVPMIASKLIPLRSTLKKKFPKVRDGSLSNDIPQMLRFFKVCHEYMVENNNMIQTPIATLDMPNDQILANLDAVIKDICKHKPLSYGPFVTHLSIHSSTSEDLDVKFEHLLPQEAVKEKEQEEETDDEGAVQASK